MRRDNHHITIEFINRNLGKSIRVSKYNGTEKYLKGIITDRLNRHAKPNITMIITNVETGAIIRFN